MPVGIEIKVDKSEMKLFQAVLNETPAGIREAIRDLMEDSLAFMVKRARSLYKSRVRDPKGSQANTIQGETIKGVKITGTGSRGEVHAEAGIYSTATGKREKDFWAQEFGADIRPVSAKILAIPLTHQAWQWETPWDADKYYARTRWRNYKLLGFRGKGSIGTELYQGARFVQIAGGKGRGLKFMQDARDQAAERMQDIFNSALAKAKGWKEAKQR